MSEPARSSPADLLDGFDPAEGFVFGPVGDSGVTFGIEAELDVKQGLTGDLADAVAGILGETAGSVAFGALPFDAALGARLAVPHNVRRGGGASGAGPAPVWTGRGLTMRSEPSLQSYRNAVSRALEHIAAGPLEKVVLARSLIVTAAAPWDAVALLRRLRAADPASYVFSAPIPHSNGSVLVGASPELLVSRSGREVRSNPLAGSARRTGDRAADRVAAVRLFADAKERREHAYVVDAARAALAPFCVSIEVDDEPTVMATARMLHLSTQIRGRLRVPEPSALHLAAALHPTPAVCGTPTEDARRTIAELEGMDRGLYAGLVGWVDENGDGEWAVTLRCAVLDGERATLFAGAGIVEGSDPQAELDETDAKFATLLDALAAS